MLTFEFIEKVVASRRVETVTPERVEIWSLYEGLDHYAQPSSWLCLGNYRLINTTQIPSWVLSFYINKQPAISDTAQSFIKNLKYPEMRTVLVSYADLNQYLSREEI
jgi:hypothetical protein